MRVVGTIGKPQRRAHVSIKYVSNASHAKSDQRHVRIYDPKKNTALSKSTRNMNALWWSSPNTFLLEKKNEKKKEDRFCKF